MNTTIETIILCTCFLVHKRKYEFQYHCKSAMVCLFLSIVIFAIAARLSLPVHVSYTCSGLLGLVIAYVLQYEAESKYVREHYSELLQKTHYISVNAMSEEELRQHCRAYGLDNIDEEIVVQRLVHHLRGKDLYEKIGYSKAQMIRREKKIENKLNIKLKDH